MNTGALFDRARILVNGAVSSSGTRVQTFARVQHGLTKPVDTNGWAGPAILTTVGATSGASAREVVEGVTLMPSDWKIVCKADTPIPADGSFLKIVRCKARDKIGAIGKLIGVKTDSSGAHVTLYYRPQK